MPRRGGWRRHGKKRFRYEDARGVRITDPAKLARIDELVIPPAWQEVWISPNPGAKLQATGIDAAGRQQYLYHPDFRAAQEQAKYDGLVRFGELLPGLRAVVASHVLLDPLSAGVDARPRRHPDQQGLVPGGLGNLRPQRPDLRSGHVAQASRGRARLAAAVHVPCQAPHARARHARRSRARRRGQGAGRSPRRVAPVPVRGRGRPPQPDRAAPERLSRRAPRRRVHGEGLPHVGREPHGGGRPGRARPAVIGHRRDAGHRSSDASRGCRARQHSCGRAGLVREPGRARAVPRRAHPRSLSRPHRAEALGADRPRSIRRRRVSSACCAPGGSAGRARPRREPQQRSRAKSAPITCTATFRTRTSPISPSGEP